MRFAFWKPPLHLTTELLYLREVSQHPKARQILSFLVRAKMAQGAQFSSVSFNTITAAIGGSRVLTSEMLSYLHRNGYLENFIETTGPNKFRSMYKPTEKADLITQLLLRDGI